MTADVVREQEPASKDVKSDDPDDFIEEIDSTDDVQEHKLPNRFASKHSFWKSNHRDLSVRLSTHCSRFYCARLFVNACANFLIFNQQQRDEPTTNVKLTPKHPRPVKVSTSKIFEPETVKRRQNLHQKYTPKPVAPILPNPSSSSSQNVPLNRQMLFRNVSPPSTERKKSPEQAERKQSPIQLSENVSLVQNGVNVIPVQLPRMQNVANISHCVCTCTCGANRPGTLLQNPQNSVQVITMDQFTGKAKQLISQMIPEHARSSAPASTHICTRQKSCRKKRKTSIHLPCLSIRSIIKMQAVINQTSNQQQLIHSTNRIISQQQQQQISKSKFSKQIIYHPKTVHVPASSSSISIAQPHTPIASTPSSSTVSNVLQKQEKVSQESDRVRTKESSPEEEEINVTEIEEKIEIKEEKKEKNKNVKSYHAPQTDILFKAIEALQKKEEAQKLQTESTEQPTQNRIGAVSAELQPEKPSEVAIKIESQEQEEIESINNIIEPTRSIQTSDGKKETVVHDLETIDFIRSFCFKDIFNKMTEEEKHERALHLIRKKAVGPGSSTIEEN
ncbi:unnamed protein product [Oikopleura dioica]|uniref:Uncharacterized protein n=1 Tax=Oikopleura dioica TaxID=34765 RepID=E4YW34_OIKDI|nr:unnamed protein product [Oikopleura dioica]